MSEQLYPAVARVGILFIIAKLSSKIASVAQWSFAPVAGIDRAKWHGPDRFRNRTSWALDFTGMMNDSRFC
jgi:hypothetical protein